MRTILIAMIAIASNLCAHSKTTDRHTVTNVNLERYMGKWYEIARYDHPFESGMDHVTATYTAQADGHISVVNQGYKNGKLKIANGRAKLKDSSDTGKLKVAFFLWFYADYYILELDQLNYSYVLIGSSTSDYLWIMSRTPTMLSKDLNYLLRCAKARGYDINKLIFCDQRPLSKSVYAKDPASTSL